MKLKNISTKQSKETLENEVKIITRVKVLMGTKKTSSKLLKNK